MGHRFRLFSLQTAASLTKSERHGCPDFVLPSTGPCRFMPDPASLGIADEPHKFYVDEWELSRVNAAIKRKKIPERINDHEQNFVKANPHAHTQRTRHTKQGKWEAATGKQETSDLGIPSKV